jgi:hypothetical protein
MVRFHEFGGPHKRSQLKASHAPFCQVYKREALSFQGSGWSGSTSSIELVSASPPLSSFFLPGERQKRSSKKYATFLELFCKCSFERFCSYRIKLKKGPSVAKFSFDTAENELSEVSFSLC